MILILQQQVIDQTQQLLQQAEAHYKKKFQPIEIHFNLRGSSAGQARLSQNDNPIIRFNNALLEQYAGDFIKRTVPHEVAHVIAHQLHKRKIKPHGPEWAEVMSLFGAEPRRCHNYDVSRIPSRRLQRIAYHCNCRSHELTSIRHNRVLQGQTYYCKQCGQQLTLSIKNHGDN